MSAVTIVTGYFTIPSKFNDHQYKEWMSSFLSLPCNMVIYTDKFNYEHIKSLRNESTTKIHFLEIENFEVYKYKAYWEYCKSIDHETYHSPELYMVWAEKTFMCERAIKENPFNSEYFFWCDIGVIRDRNMLPHVMNFPSLEKVQIEVPKDKFFLSSIESFRPRDFELNEQYISPIFCNSSVFSSSEKSQNERACPQVIRIQGGFFGGHIDAWSEWIRLFRKELDLFIETKTFGGKDQYIMSNIYIKDILTKQQKIYLKQAPYIVKNLYVNPWFAFLYYLS